MTFHRALWVAILCALSSQTALAGWTLYRFEGREYVSLDEVATFYGFPKPPSVSATAPASPATTPAPTRASVATEFGLALRDLADPDAKPITLDSGTMQLEVTPGLREARINGVKQWLAFPVHQEGNKILVSRLDLSKGHRTTASPGIDRGIPPREHSRPRSRPRRPR